MIFLAVLIGYLRTPKRINLNFPGHHTGNIISGATSKTKCPNENIKICHQYWYIAG